MKLDHIIFAWFTTTLAVVVIFNALFGNGAVSPMAPSHLIIGGILAAPIVMIGYVIVFVLKSAIRALRSL